MLCASLISKQELEDQDYKNREVLDQAISNMTVISYGNSVHMSLYTILAVAAHQRHKQASRVAPGAMLPIPSKLTLSILLISIFGVEISGGTVFSLVEKGMESVSAIGVEKFALIFNICRIYYLSLLITTSIIILLITAIIICQIRISDRWIEILLR